MPDSSHVNQLDFVAVPSVSIPSIDSNRDDKAKVNHSALEDCKEAETEPPLVMVSTSVKNKNNSIAALAGKYAQEPLWSEFLKSIQEYDQEVNLREEKTE